MKNKMSSSPSCEILLVFITVSMRHQCMNSETLKLQTGRICSSWKRWNFQEKMTEVLYFLFQFPTCQVRGSNKGRFFLNSNSDACHKHHYWVFADMCRLTVWLNLFAILDFGKTRLQSSLWLLGGWTTRKRCQTAVSLANLELCPPWCKVGNLHKQEQLMPDTTKAVTLNQALSEKYSIW